MTKQGMGQLVKDLERQGLVTRQQDPDDRRAANVRFTQSGLRFLGEAVAVTQELDAEYRAILGDQQMDNLLQALRALTTPKQID
jgi:DNA-binding MarR family transcriptional regulator